MLEIPTGALRSRSAEALSGGLLTMPIQGESEWSKDYRDLMIALAPFHNCARRLGLDPAVVFDQAARAGPADLADVVRAFGRRTDVTPSAFAFTVRDTPEGPEYGWADSWRVS